MNALHLKWLAFGERKHRAKTMNVKRDPCGNAQKMVAKKNLNK